MKMRLIASALVLLVSFGCRSAPPSAGLAAEAAPEPPRGLTVLPYGGDWADYPPVRAAQEDLGTGSARAADLVARRLGISIDPDRPRQIVIVDGATSPVLETRLVEGRMTQVLEIPAVPLARGNVPLGETLSYVFALAAISDLAGEDMPEWYRSGAPLWISGRWERALYHRVLAGPLVPERIDDVVPPFSPERRAKDPLAAALFFRFLSEEFGADRIPALSRSLLSAETPAEAFRVALGAAPASLPVAYDGYRVRVVGEILANDFVRLLAASRRRAPADRIPALSGLAARAPNRFVAAAVLEDLALAQFEAGRFGDAASTFARIERDYTAYTLNPDRDLLFFALTFARTDDPAGARVRIVSFLAEYPRSPHASLALLELASLLTESGETVEALTRYAELVRRFPDSPHAGAAHLVIAATARASHRFALARRHLEAALPDEGAKRALVDLDTLEAKGLSAAAEAVVRSSVRDLVGGDEDRASAAVALLAEIGPLVKPWLAAPFGGRLQFSMPAAARLRALEVIGTWPREQAWPGPLVDFLHGEDPDVAERLFDILASLEITDTEIVAALDLAPYSVSAAAAEFDRRYRATSETDALVRSPSFSDRMIGAGRLATEERDDALLLLGRLLRDPSPQVRRAAAAALGRREERNAGRVLAPAFADESRLVRIEALSACARLGDVEPARSRGLADADGTVRTAMARVLLATEESEDIVRVVGLLSDTDGMVRTAVEQILRSRDPDEMGPALARALRRAELPGHGVRIVRVMSHHTGVDFRYDAFGGIEERKRVAAEFLAVWPRRKNQ